MKKLMIAVGAMLSAAVVNAAAIDWSIEAAWDPIADDDMGDGYYAFIIADTGTGASATYGRDLALAALAGGDASFVKTYALGEGATFAYGEAVQYTVGDFDNNQTVKAYAVILDADSVANATKAYITDLGNTPINEIGGSPMLGFGDISDGTGDLDNWYTLASSPVVPDPGDAPEPTSGMLLMLGVAGLALKRKRA